MRDLVGHHRAADAGVLGPAVHAGLEEGAVDDQLTAAVEQVEQARPAVGPVERVLLLHGQPRHPPTLGGQRVTGAGQLLLLHEQLLARGLPLLADTIGGVFMTSSPCGHHGFRSFPGFSNGASSALSRTSATRSLIRRSKRLPGPVDSPLEIVVRVSQSLQRRGGIGAKRREACSQTGRRRIGRSVRGDPYRGGSPARGRWSLPRRRAGRPRSEAPARRVRRRTAGPLGRRRCRCTRRLPCDAARRCEGPSSPGLLCRPATPPAPCSCFARTSGRDSDQCGAECGEHDVALAVHDRPVAGIDRLA